MKIRKIGFTIMALALCAALTMASALPAVAEIAPNPTTPVNEADGNIYTGAEETEADEPREEEPEEELTKPQGEEPEELLISMPFKAGITAVADYTLYYNSSDGKLHNGSLNGGEVASAAGFDYSGGGTTLTLGDFTFETTAPIALVMPPGCTIKLSGDAEITSAYTGQGFNCASADDPDWLAAGIYSEGSLNIEADDVSNTLLAQSGECTGEYGYSSGIQIDGDGALTITGGEITAIGGGADVSSGIYTDGGMSLSNNAKALAEAADAGISSFGVSVGYEAELTMSGSASLTATAGNALTAASSYMDSVSYGASVGSLKMRDSAVLSAYAGDAYNNSTGLYAYGALEMSGTSKLTAVSGESTNPKENDVFGGYSYGLHVNGNADISGNAEIQAEASKSVKTSIGLYVSNRTQLSGSAQLNAEGGESMNTVGAVFGNALSLTGSSKLHAQGGYAKNNGVVYDPAPYFPERATSYGIYGPALTEVFAGAELTAIGGYGYDGNNDIDYSSSVGFYSEGDVMLSGKMEVQGGTASNSSGLNVKSASVNMAGNAQMLAVGGDTNNDDDWDYGQSWAASIGKSLNMSGNSRFEARCGNAGWVEGIILTMGSADISGNARVYAYAGNPGENLVRKNAYGMRVATLPDGESFKLSGNAAVTAYAGKAETSIGIFCNNIEISGGELNAIASDNERLSGSTSEMTSAGIHSSIDPKLKITGGIIHAESGSGKSALRMTAVSDSLKAASVTGWDGSRYSVPVQFVGQYTGYYTFWGTYLASDENIPVSKVRISPKSQSGGSGGGGGAAPTPSPEPLNPVLEASEIGSVATGENATTVQVDSAALEKLLASEGQNNITIDVSDDTGAAIIQLPVQLMAEMSEGGTTLSVQLGGIVYEISPSAIDVPALIGAFGTDDLSGVQINITVTSSVGEDIMQAVNDALDSSGAELVIPALQFSVTATYDGKTVSVDEFSGYVSRVVEITEEQAGRITTAVIVEPDGTLRHVPTRIYEKDGKWYAEINSMTNSTYALIYNDKTFTDTVGKWFEADVGEMAGRGIISGIGGELFAGERDITRAEFTAIIINALGLPQNGDGTVFSDVPYGAWYAGAVGKAYEYGIVSGMGDGMFAPEKSVTRQEAMLILKRAAKITGLNGEIGSLDAFADAEDLGAWALEAARWSVGSGLIAGSNGMLEPRDEVTRAETASMVLRLMQKSGLVDVRSKS